VPAAAAAPFDRAVEKPAVPLYLHVAMCAHVQDLAATPCKGIVG
jgi:hypothetical protein